jgi:hypothetical protein
LILEKQRDPSAKSAKIGPRVDYEETWGFFAKFLGILIYELFSNG